MPKSKNEGAKIEKVPETMARKRKGGEDVETMECVRTRMADGTETLASSERHQIELYRRYCATRATD